MGTLSWDWVLQAMCIAVCFSVKCYCPLQVKTRFEITPNSKGVSNNTFLFVPVFVYLLIFVCSTKAAGLCQSAG